MLKKRGSLKLIVCLMCIIHCNILDSKEKMMIVNDGALSNAKMPFISEFSNFPHLQMISTHDTNYPLIPADDKNITYVGRIDFNDPKKPKFWASGVYIRAKFQGTNCEIVINDEEKWGSFHNYLEVVIDGIPSRIRTSGKTNTIKVAAGLSEGFHTIEICKDTESSIGYLEFLGFKCKGLLPIGPESERKLEFIGNSITCGAGSDQSVVKCGAGVWHDQHNAFMAYGPVLARKLNAQWYLSSYSGIGLIHSCCNINFTMPEVYGKMNFTPDGNSWDFSRYTPDAVTICLGQNDGVQDSLAFCNAYVLFINGIREKYPQAHIICLTSPMGDEKLTSVLKNYLTGIVNNMNEKGDLKVHRFFFSRSYKSGCDSHPDLEEHQQIAGELEPFLKKVMGW